MFRQVKLHALVEKSIGANPMCCTLRRFWPEDFGDETVAAESCRAFAPAVVLCAIHTKCLEILWQLLHIMCTEGTFTDTASSAFVLAIQDSKLQKPSKLNYLVEMAHQVGWLISSEGAMSAAFRRSLALATVISTA